MPNRSALLTGLRTLIRLAGAALLVAAVFVPAAAAGASGGCIPLVGVLGLCSSATTSGDVSDPTATCGNETLTKADGLPWDCTFDDEFDGQNLDRAKWTVQTTAQYGFHSGTECMVDSPDNIAVAQGSLRLTVRDVGAPFVCQTPTRDYTTRYSGASVFTKAFGQLYGRFEIRAKFPESYGVSGIQSSLWLFPRQMVATTLLSGTTEIDIAEAYSRRPNLVVPTVHGLTLSPYLLNSYCTVPDWGADFHTYAMEWNPSQITFIYDGKPCMRVSTPPSLTTNLLARSPFLVALSQAMGVGLNENSDAPPVPGTEEIDYVRVWK